MKNSRIIIAIIIGLFFFKNLLMAKKKSASDKPNVLMIVVDDLNGFGVNKIFPIVQTPHLDKLADQSINFVNAACNTPVCNPSRSSFFSGLYPHTSGSYLNASDAWNRSEIMKEIRNLPECFKDNGYTTWGRGKLTHSAVPKEREKGMWDNPQNKNGGFGPFPEDKKYWLGGNRFKSIKGYEDDQIFPDVWNADSAIAFINKDHQKPFFMCYGMWRPHSPYTAPQRFFDMYDEKAFTLPPSYKENDLDDVPFLGRMLVDSLRHHRHKPDTTYTKLKKFLYAYAANTSFADWNIGRVIEALNHSEYAENTLVILFSDNGYHCGSKQRWEKATLWDMADLVPMLVRTPERKKATCKATVSLVDVFPTLIDYCQIDQPNQVMDGKSFAHLLNNPGGKWDKPSFTSYGIKYSSVRTERYRYIQYPDGTEELYDHEKDPFEFNNLANQPEVKEVIEAHKKHLPAKWAESTGGRLEVIRDYDQVMRKLTPLHKNYEKLRKK